MAKGSLLFLLGLLALGTVHGSFMGKLASKKICADDVCEYKNMYTISLARAQKMYEGPDCRFLSFSEGQQIYIYSKLVKEDEEDEEYWAASVYVQCLLDQRGNIGYFPSNLVEEIQVFKEATKELPTTVTFQKSPSQQAYYADSEIVGKVRLQELIHLRCQPFYVGHLRAHSDLPGPLVAGNALADATTQLTFPVLIGSVTQAQQAHALYHLNANTLASL
nr:unnamed protein product [Sorex araneus]